MKPKASDSPKGSSPDGATSLYAQSRMVAAARRPNSEIAAIARPASADPGLSARKLRRDSTRSPTPTPRPAVTATTGWERTALQLWKPVISSPYPRMRIEWFSLRPPSTHARAETRARAVCPRASASLALRMLADRGASESVLMVHQGPRCHKTLVNVAAQQVRGSISPRPHDGERPRIYRASRP